MFLNRNPRNGSHFLILMSCADAPELPMRGLVRRTALYQLGQFMMGSVTITGTKTESFADGPERKVPWKHRVTLSGTYGGDGLSVTVPRAVFDKGTEVPAELVAAWNTGGGWNSAGSEGPAMRAWGLELMRKEAQAKARTPRPRATGPMRAAEASRYYYQTVRGEIASHMRRVIDKQMTHDEMVKDWNIWVQREPQWSRAPAWVYHHAFGARDAFQALLYSHFLDWRVFHKEHGLVTKERMRDLNYYDVIAELGAHCWTTTGKPWNEKPRETKEEVNA